MTKTKQETANRRHGERKGEQETRGEKEIKRQSKGR